MGAPCVPQNLSGLKPSIRKENATAKAIFYWYLIYDRYIIYTLILQYISPHWQPKFLPSNLSCYSKGSKYAVFLFYLFSFEKNGSTLIYMSRINTERLFSCQLFSSQFWYDAFYQPWILHLLCFKPDSLYRGVNPIYLPTFYVFFSHNQILSMFGCPMLTSTFVSARQWQCTKML